MNYFRKPGDIDIKDIIKTALREDIGQKDITTAAIIPKAKYAKAILLAKEDCVICGVGIADEVFKAQDKNIKFKPRVSDGQKIKKGKIIAHIFGRAQSILTAERVALNFLSLLSGVATKTRAYVDKIKPYKANVLDTRKTIPGLRVLEKYAVRIGGGYNHRMRLDEMILIKDNHLKVWSPESGVRSSINDLRQKTSKNIKIEIEVKNLKEFNEALKLRPDIIMLDNMGIEDMKKAVRIRNSRLTTYNLQLKLEASGGINLKNVRKIAACGVEMISIGELTHSVKAIDISLEIL
ncbi:MAG: carboxylating nicotinate-nucleotide diphosphorylase [Candidatus Omnitrophota bacterium]|nr:carboxylating nicotinate-nucleotide diphosphorylase [Candidatus Omnitrophota bacterium]